LENKSKILFSTTIVVILITSMMLTILPANAQTTYTNKQDGGSVALPSGVTPDVTVETTAYLSFRPNPVGKDQTFLVNMWLTPATHASRYLSDYKVTITKPDGTQDVITLDSYKADTTAYFEYIADQVGTWKLQFEFPGGFYPAGNYTVDEGTYIGNQVVSFPKSCYYAPSKTAEQTLVVQEEIVASWIDPTPTPTDYWTRPVSPEHRDWVPFLGNYPGTGIVGGSNDPNWPADTNAYKSNYDFTPYVQAPDTSHVVWKRQGAISGLIGGSQGQISLTRGGGNPSIIYSGRCYQSVTKVFDGVTQSVWQCYDLRTGEIYWEKTGVTQVPTTISYQAYATANTAAAAGKEAANLGGLNVALMYVGSGRIIKYDPWSGSVTMNVSTSPLTSATQYGDMLFLSIQNLGNASKPNYRLINWTLSQSVGPGPSYTVTYKVDVLGNVSFPWSSLGTAVDYEAGIAATTTAVNDATAIGAYYGTRIQAASIVTGQLLWDKTVEDTMYSSSCTVADHGKVAAVMMSGCYNAYDLRTGNLAWTSEQMDYPWSAPGFGAYAVQSAYGMIFREAYDGIYAFDWDDGSIVWHYVAPANPYETPYTDENGTTVYSFDAGATIADGKIFSYTTEHTPSQPITRGWGLHCIDAYTGEGIWNITGYMTPGAIADGYITASCGYDGYTYVFGKGKSATTVSVPQIAISSGTSAIISGTVLDMSPAQEGTACVSKESMTQWMEYLHLQRSIPSNVVGVPVSIDAVDPNGNAVHIADVTSDMSGTFSYTWTPTMEGDYTITASFMGDDSYGSSWAETHATVAQAPEETPVTTAISFDSINSSVTTTIIGGVVAIIIAVALVGLLILKKK
jgi:hypothetical protein